MESSHIHIPLHEGQYYHIYNRGNGGIPIFYNERNYSYFLKKYDEYLSDVLETYAYCLLPNHFHLLVRVKDFPSFETGAPALESLKLPSSKEKTGETIVSELFRRFLMSYSKSINTQENRKGSLFQKNFRRVHIDNESYFTTVISYIHSQMRHHGFKTKDEDYPWSSYRRMLLERPTKLQKEYVLEWFGGKEEYIKFHRTNNSFHEIKKYIIEE